MPVAVITGDIVGSTSLPPERQAGLMSALETAAADIGHWQGAALNFTRQRGDGWQVVLSHPRLALRAALYFQSAVRQLGAGLATRISIATGDGEPPGSTNLNDATGAVFVASGRGLDSMQPSQRIRHTAGGSLGAAVCLADHLAQGWTPAQARALHPMLAPTDPPRQSEVARHLGITPQAVAKALDRAGFAPLSAALQMIETAEETAQEPQA